VKIHYVSPHFHPEIGGVEDHVLRLGRHMVVEGHEVTVHTSRISLTGTSLPQQDTIDGIMIQRYTPGIRLGYYATTFRPRIGEGDILHCHGYAFLPNDFAVRHYHGRMGTVFTTHHGVRMTPPTLRARMMRRFYDLRGLGTLRKADRVFTSSRADKQWLIERNVISNRIEVVPDGIADEAFIPGAKAFAQRHGLANYIMFLGRVHWEKCIDHLLSAVAKIGRRDLQIAVVGPDAGATDELRQTADRLGLRDSVKFIGQVSQDEKKGILAGCSLLALPSLYEAQGLVILEAWAQGKPIVASRVGGVPDMVENGVNGLLYDWGDIGELATSISRILNDPAFAIKLGEAGRTTASERYRWSSVAERIEVIYAAVLAERPFRHKI